jgi:hypothetical protein
MVRAREQGSARARQHGGKAAREQGGEGARWRESDGQEEVDARGYACVEVYTAALCVVGVWSRWLVVVTVPGE